MLRPRTFWLRSEASARPIPTRSGVLTITKRIVFHTLFQKRGNCVRLAGSKICWYQRRPTKGPSRRAVES
jgi:hypothetical protein